MLPSYKQCNVYFVDKTNVLMKTGNISCTQDKKHTKNYLFSGEKIMLIVLLCTENIFSNQTDISLDGAYTYNEVRLRKYLCLQGKNSTLVFPYIMHIVS